MNAEFNWWLLIVGLVIGAALVYLVLADASRRESEVTSEEQPREATWIATTLRAEGVALEPETAERILELHRLYLSAPPPDDPDETEAAEAEAADAELVTAEPPEREETDAQLRAREDLHRRRDDAAMERRELD